MNSLGWWLDWCLIGSVSEWKFPKWGEAWLWWEEPAKGALAKLLADSSSRPIVFRDLTEVEYFWCRGGKSGLIGSGSFAVSLIGPATPAPILQPAIPQLIQCITAPCF